MDAANDATSDASDASTPVPVTTETANCMPISGPAEDCSCAAGEVAISGGAYSGQLGNMLNASQAGPSFGGATQTWRVSCVTPTDAGTSARVACGSPFAECLSGSSTSAVHVETANCVSISGTAYDCSLQLGRGRDFRRCVLRAAR
jgi:hypothetical protein